MMGESDEAVINTETQELIELSKRATPLSNGEWRELLTACRFRWTILTQDNEQAAIFKGKHTMSKVLRRSNFYVDLPIASHQVIRNIALHSP